MLTKFETTNIIGMRALQLSEGAVPNVTVSHAHLKYDFIYIATLELANKKLDVKVVRKNNNEVHTSELEQNPLIDVLLDLKDGGTRSYTM